MPEIQDSRIRHKRATSSGAIATVPTSSDHTDGSWLTTDIYIGELLLNQVDDKFYIRTESGIKQIPLSVGGQGIVLAASGTIASADILTINSTPIIAVAAPGAGFAIEMIEGSARMAYAGTAYATDTTLLFQIDTGAGAQFELESLLQVTVNPTFVKASRVISDPFNTGQTSPLVENKDLTITTLTSDPTLGNSDVDWWILYRIIPLP